MIVLEPATAPDVGATLWLRPNRSLTRRGVRHWSWALGVLIIGVAVVCAGDGNVFAPVFAVVEAVAVAVALRIAWLGTRRSERITLDEHTLEVEGLPEHRSAQFIPYWVRVGWRPGHGHRRLVLTSHGREYEVGAFLADEEREELSRQLKALLADLTAPRRA